MPGRKPVHFLVSHPTPPTFDGTEDRNGTRNHDEIRFWADYVSGGAQAAYIYDDAGETGGLGRGQDFVIAGDQNADPFDGDSVDRAIQQLLDHPRIQDPHPTSAGAVEATRSATAAPTSRTPVRPPRTPPTSPTPRPATCAPTTCCRASGSTILGSGVFWLPSSDPLFPRLTGTFPFPTSDHRMVWLDVRLR